MSAPKEERKSRTFSLHRLHDSLLYALRGIGRLFTTGANFRILTLCTVLVLIASFLFHLTAYEWLAVLICIALVLSLEGVNSALEMLADQVSADYSPLIRDAKDMAAGAVLIAACVAFIIAIVIFLPKIIALF